MNIHACGVDDICETRLANDEAPKPSPLTSERSEDIVCAARRRYRPRLRRGFRPAAPRPDFVSYVAPLRHPAFIGKPSFGTESRAPTQIPLRRQAQLTLYIQNPASEIQNDEAPDSFESGASFTPCPGVARMGGDGWQLSTPGARAASAGLGVAA